MNDPREEKLPVWAKQLLEHLRKEIQHGCEPLLKELAVLRPKNAQLKAENDALRELLGMAAKGGHIAAAEIMKVIEEYAPWKD